MGPAETRSCPPGRRHPPDEARYGTVSAIALLPLGIPQVLVLGSHEEFVSLSAVDAYVRAATAAGDHLQRILIPGAGHFEIASPLSFTWPQIKLVIGSLVDGKLAPEVQRALGWIH